MGALILIIDSLTVFKKTPSINLMKQKMYAVDIASALHVGINATGPRQGRIVALVPLKTFGPFFHGQTIVIT